MLADLQYMPMMLRHHEANNRLQLRTYIRKRGHLRNLMVHLTTPICHL